MQTKPITEANYTISDGDAGIYETVDYMWNYALRDTAENAVKKLVKALNGKRDIDTIYNIYTWVWNNVKYENDPPDREMITAPIHFVNGNRTTGDCDCMTTLLVCLLESAGYDCAIKVIAWRLDEFTHVYAEVWHNNNWLTLDPTLKENGFGEQDKKIRRFKRITKKDMQKLTVLSDTTNAHKELSPPRRIRKCRAGNKDDNKNVNNININFGTNVENSHNPSSYRSNSRQVGASELPQLTPTYEPQKPEAVNVPIILKPVVSGGVTTFEPQGINTLIGSLQGAETTTPIIATKNDRIIYQKTNTPAYVPPYRDRGKGYIEFP
ncbi:MAG: transglutaminase-like domain-containing protein [Ignavibacteria bacterium]|jgi:hypothetical protein|nr:transglutaminase-like domain-containing protein [Ignavibacteria bacterium]